jgi:hypothetical protein
VETTDRNAAGRSALRRWANDVADAWNRFWFQPRDAATLSAMRIAVGAMLVYTHLVWTLELEAFLGADGLFDARYRREFFGGSPFAWTHFALSDSSLWLWGSHLAALAVMIAFMAGACTRVTSILSALLVISYAHRAPAALFGLDQINCFLTLYLALGPCGARYSVDAWWRRRRGRQRNGAASADADSVSANVSTRLIQLHLCVVYLFAGLGKLQGAGWWDGTAIWGAIASYEYQTIDLTFLYAAPWLVNAITLVTLAWECSYAFLVWPRLTRPLWMAMAVLVHLGIGFGMGMLTFGLIMVIANMAFIEPDTMRRLMPGRRAAATG